MTASELYHEATKRGLRLEPAGDRLAVIPARLCPPEFADMLRRHKGELLDWLEARAAGLAPDSAAWLHVAKQVLAGEFDGCDGSTRASLNIGLRSIQHPLCQRAIEKLRTKAKQP
jgi:hypothetical protein